jgi:hypothetical protein
MNIHLTLVNWISKSKEIPQPFVRVENIQPLQNTLLSPFREWLVASKVILQKNKLKLISLFKIYTLVLRLMSTKNCG